MHSSLDTGGSTAQKREKHLMKLLTFSQIREAILVETCIFVLSVAKALFFESLTWVCIPTKNPA